MSNTHVLETEALRIEISDAGAELVSVTDKASGAERIWTADPAVWNRHAPILFPFVGRVTGGVYRLHGREYPMKTQHGFARDRVFSCTEASERAVEHCLCADEETRGLFPWDFRLTVRHSVDPARSRVLRVDWTVENRGESTMLYAIGGHPGFLMPEGAVKEDCSLVFPGKESLRYYQADAAGFALPQQTVTLPLREGAAPYRADIPGTWIFDAQDIDEVGIAAPDGRRWVTLRCPGFPFLAVWANAKGPFLCLEPWFGRTDEAGFAGTLEEKKGMERLAGGETRRYSYEIEFHR